jgi:hypothetical protein
MKKKIYQSKLYQYIPLAKNKRNVIAAAVAEE